MSSSSKKPESVPIRLLFSTERKTRLQGLRVTHVKNRKDGRWIPEVQYPIDEIDREGALGGPTLFKTLLPTLSQQGETSIDYDGVRPKRASNILDRQENDPERRAHIMMILLGIYALGADRTNKGDQLARTLATWTSSTFPTLPSAKLQPVDLIEQKLAAIYTENEKYAKLRTGDKQSPPIKNLLLAESNRSRVNEFLGSANAANAKTPISRIEEKEDCIHLYANNGSNSPWLTIHFAPDFNHALELVFGDFDLGRIERRQKQEAKWERTKQCSPWIVTGLILLTAALIYGFWNQPADRITMSGDDGIVGLDESGETVWNREFGDKILRHGPLDLGDGKERFFVTLYNDGEDSGWFYALDAKGETLFRIHPETKSQYDPNRPFNLQYGIILTADVDPAPGREIILGTHTDWFPSSISVVSAEGEVLKTFWHPGTISDPVMMVSGTSIMIGQGPNNAILDLPAALKEKHPPQPDTFYHLAIYAYDLSNLSRESQALGVIRNMPVATPVFYYIFAPRSIGCSELELLDQKADSGGTILQFKVGSINQFQIDTKTGTIVKRAPTEELSPPTIELISLEHWMQLMQAQ